MTTEVPTRGALVRARGDVWIATDISPTKVTDGRVQHLVKLLSVSDDRHGETARLFWQVEPDAKVLDAVHLPAPSLDDDGHLVVDDPRTLDAFLNAVRWGAITNADADVLESPYRSGIDIVDYQLEPLVRALDMPRISLLIADDVGLGKTIEAGLIAQELDLRHRMRNCLIVCPAGLQDKWQKEMRSRFGIEFRICNSDFVTEVRRRNVHLNPLKAYPHLITSIDWIKRPERGRMLDDAFIGDPDEFPRPFDLLILDEAHLAAPAGANYAIDSDRTQIIKHVAPYFEHRLFLTATPHNGHSSSFHALLELLDPRRFDKNVEPSREDIDRVMVRRLKADIRKVDETVPFPRRELHAEEVRYHDHEADAYERLLAYLDRLEKLNVNRKAAKSSVRFVGETLRKRLLSSPAAFAGTILQHHETLTTKGHNLKNGPVAAAQPSSRALLDAIDAAAEGYETDEDAAAAARDAVELAAHALVYDDDLLAELEWLIEWGTRHDRSESGRLDTLRALIDDVCRDGKNWTDGRLIVFTEYLDTHKYLYEKLVAGGVDKTRIRELRGGMRDEDRVHIAELFNHPPGDDANAGTTVRILLCTDTASEGIDLHQQCHDLIHYDVPWNPSRMEQRNGRIDRHGQTSDTADIHHFTGLGETSIGRDTRIERRVADKLSTVLTDLGGANPLFDQLEVAQKDALRTGETIDLDRYDADVEAHRSKTALRATERQLRALLDDVRTRLDATRAELDADPAEVRHTVDVALALSHQPTLQPHPTTPGLFSVPSLSAEWIENLKDLVDPISKVRRFVTFDARLAEPAPGPILAHLNHPFVAHATALLRSQVWTTTTQDQLHRVTSRAYDPAAVEGDYDWIGDLAVVAHARVLITGADGNRLHEQVVARAARFRDGRWAQLDADVHADGLWAARRPDAVEADRELHAQWDKVAEDLVSNLERRGQRLAEIKQKALQTRMEEELARLESDVDRAADAMREALDRTRNQLDSAQISLFADDEAEQLEHDYDRLQARYETIRDKVRTEITSVRERYATQDVRVFPIAVTFLHPHLS
ncbi:DISARM system SNF2-like helicase DrmD [Salsipaludibacter albus]|uniref:DISARM system SNF2-like helicase DrmD n=1 Tax=Salsipaludibacter albus TaxID=2849650 RepID=UPI0023687330|nr:DISARM system SNF2-like helicase DrmD [Salsipaludibacter albus]MBY5162097.1 DISARM system SNF2-like helicase DrmD [Salsipaludibacter albus]